METLLNCRRILTYAGLGTDRYVQIMDKPVSQTLMRATIVLPQIVSITWYDSCLAV